MRSSPPCLPCFRCPHFPLQPAARKPPPQEPCQNGALILLPFPVLGGVLGSMVFGGDVGIGDGSGSGDARDSSGGGRWWPSNPSFLLLWLGGTHNLLFCTGLYWHEQRIDGRQAFFLPGRKLAKGGICEDRIRRDSPLLLPASANPIQTRDDGAQTHDEELWHMICAQCCLAWRATHVSS